MADSKTLRAGENYVVAVGGTAVIAVPAGPGGGFIENPLTADGQGIVSAETIYVSPVAAPGSTDADVNDTTFAIYPGQRWDIIAGQDSPTWVNAATNGHKFSVVYW